MPYGINWVPPHVRHSLNHWEVASGAVLGVLLAIGSNVVTHFVLESQGNSMFYKVKYIAYIGKLIP